MDAIWLFGSRARGYARARSDVDLAVLFSRATREGWSKVLDVVEEADTLLEIDCLRFDALPEGSDLCDNILRTRQVMFARVAA